MSVHILGTELPLLVLILAVLTAVVGVGRLSRIVTYDSFPPAQLLRMRWSDWTDNHGHPEWGLLLNCLWCATPWIMLVAVGWFLLGLVVTWIAVAWWVFWAWMALSYLTSMMMVRDDPTE